MEKLLLFIPIENIGFAEYVQTFSFFAIFSVFLFPFFSILFRVKKSILFNTLLILISWFIISTIFNSLIRLDTPSNLLRILVGLIIGFLIYFFVREITNRSTKFRIFIWLKYSYIIILFFSIYDILFKFEGYRLYASYTEPSHLGTDLALIYLPMFMVFSKYMTKKEKFFIFISLTTIVIATFSATTFLKIQIFLILFYLFTIIKKPKYLLYFFMLIIIFILSFFILIKIFPDNYFSIMANAMITNFEYGYENLPISFTDRFSFWIALFNIKNISLSLENILDFLLGGGLGNDLLPFNYLPEPVIEQIISVKAFGSYITSFIGRVFFYGGFIGFMLYFTFLYFVYKNIKLISSTTKEKTVFNAWLITLFFSTTFDLAPFQTVALWFLPAYVDGLSLKRKRTIISLQRKSHD